MVVITIVKWGYKPTYNVWGPHTSQQLPILRLLNQYRTSRPLTHCRDLGPIVPSWELELQLQSWPRFSLSLPSQLMSTVAIFAIQPLFSTFLGPLPVRRGTQSQWHKGRPNTSANTSTPADPWIPWSGNAKTEGSIPPTLSYFRNLFILTDWFTTTETMDDFPMFYR